jgi:hypothetical protein
VTPRAFACRVHVVVHVRMVHTLASFLPLGFFFWAATSPKLPRELGVGMATNLGSEPEFLHPHCALPLCGTG